MKKRFLHLEWNFLHAPTYQENQVRSMYYSDKRSFERSINREEIDRYEFTRSAADEIPRLKPQLEKNLKISQQLLESLAIHVKSNYANIIDKYAFLQNIIQISYPWILEDVRSD